MLTKIKTWIVGAALGVALFALFLWRTYRAGFDSAETRQMEDTLNKITKGEKIEKGTDALSDSRVTERLRELGWVRRD